MPAIITGSPRFENLESVDDYFSLAYLLLNELVRSGWIPADEKQVAAEELEAAFESLAREPNPAVIQSAS